MRRRFDDDSLRQKTQLMWQTRMNFYPKLTEEDLYKFDVAPAHHPLQDPPWQGFDSPSGFGGADARRTGFRRDADIGVPKPKPPPEIEKSEQEIDLEAEIARKEQIARKAAQAAAEAKLAAQAAAGVERAVAQARARERAEKRREAMLEAKAGRKGSPYRIEIDPCAPSPGFGGVTPGRASPSGRVSPSGRGRRDSPS